MHGSGEEERETIRPEFDRSIMIDFRGAKITISVSRAVAWSTEWLQTCWNRPQRKWSNNSLFTAVLERQCPVLGGLVRWRAR